MHLTCGAGDPVLDRFLAGVLLGVCHTDIKDATTSAKVDSSGGGWLCLPPPPYARCSFTGSVRPSRIRCDI